MSCQSQPAAPLVPHDLDALSQALGRALLACRLQLATAESCTGGGIAEAVTRTPGSSAWFGHGWVTYSNAAKEAQLGVPAGLLAAHGAVSEPVVRAMAEGARQRAGADWAVAVSGIAGPDGGTPDKPVGLVWFAWAGPENCFSEACVFPGDRAAVRAHSVSHAMRKLILEVSGGEAATPVP